MIHDRTHCARELTALRDNSSPMRRPLQFVNLWQSRRSYLGLDGAGAGRVGGGKKPIKLRVLDDVLRKA